jgi:hypothetical protein
LQARVIAVRRLWLWLRFRLRLRLQAALQRTHERTTATNPGVHVVVRHGYKVALVRSTPQRWGKRCSKNHADAFQSRCAALRSKATALASEVASSTGVRSAAFISATRSRRPPSWSQRRTERGETLVAAAAIAVGTPWASSSVKIRLDLLGELRRSPRHARSLAARLPRRFFLQLASSVQQSERRAGPAPPPEPLPSPRRQPGE